MSDVTCPKVRPVRMISEIIRKVDLFIKNLLLFFISQLMCNMGAKGGKADGRPVEWKSWFCEIQ